MRYIHQLTHWPNFSWNDRVISGSLAKARFKQGEFLGKISVHDQDSQNKSVVETLTDEILASSAIENEPLDREVVRSSVASKAGLAAVADPSPGEAVVRKNADGFVNVLWEATSKFDAPLTAERLFAWHRMLFGEGVESGIEVGQWRSGRSGAMRVVSERAGGDDFVHFEAPTASRVPEEMDALLEWFASDSSDYLLKAAVAHLWFLTIHPFEDGNGRIARVISELCLARSEGSSKRFYSFSSQIEKERRDYYLGLEFSQKGELDITDWILWFLGCLERAISAASERLEREAARRHVFEELLRHSPNERQILIVRMLLEDFAGKLTSSKYAKLAKCSQDSAIRDINRLVEIGILIPSEAGGRSRSYACVLPRNF